MAISDGTTLTTRPGCAGATSASRPVDVGLGVGGQVEVHDAGHVVDVDTARRHVRGHEGGDVAAPERLEGAVALRLRPITVDGRGLHTRLTELARDTIGAALGAAEDDGRTVVTDELADGGDAVGALDGPEHDG